MPDATDLSVLLQRANHGDSGANEDLFTAVYGELRRIAGQLMSDERTEHTLQATALVHEAWLKLAGDESGTETAHAAPHWNGHRHFLRAAARAMRNLLVDHARARATEKRGGDRERFAIDEVVTSYEDRGIDLLALDEAVEILTALDPELARVVELRLFAGLGSREVAELDGVSLRSAERSWNSARVFLRKHLEDRE